MIETHPLWSIVLGWLVGNLAPALRPKLRTTRECANRNSPTRDSRIGREPNSARIGLPCKTTCALCNGVPQPDLSAAAPLTQPSPPTTGVTDAACVIENSDRSLGDRLSLSSSSSLRAPPPLPPPAPTRMVARLLNTLERKLRPVAPIWAPLADRKLQRQLPRRDSNSIGLVAGVGPISGARVGLVVPQPVCCSDGRN